MCNYLISGNRLKCVSCRIIVHESCSASLNDLFTCRPSFCESVRKYREFTSIPHHWVQRKQLKVRINDTTINISRLNKGGIQKLRGPNFTQIWFPTPLAWTNMDILHTICPLSRDPPWTFYWPPILPPSSCLLATQLLNDP